MTKTRRIMIYGIIIFFSTCFSVMIFIIENAPEFIELEDGTMIQGSGSSYLM